MRLIHYGHCTLMFSLKCTFDDAKAPTFSFSLSASSVTYWALLVKTTLCKLLRKKKYICCLTNCPSQPRTHFFEDKTKILKETFLLLLYEYFSLVLGKNDHTINSLWCHQESVLEQNNKRKHPWHPEDLSTLCIEVQWHTFASIFEPLVVLIIVDKSEKHGHFKPTRRVMMLTVCF